VEKAAERGDRGCHRFGNRMLHVLRSAPAELGETMNENAAADPQHGHRADQRQHLEKRRHAVHQHSSERLGNGSAPLRQIDAEIVGLDDQRHRAIDAARHQKRDGRQHERLDGQIGLDDAGKRDRHDFCREHHVGADGTVDLLVLQRLGIDGGLSGAAPGVLRMRRQHAVHLLIALETQIQRAGHQDRRQQPRGENRQQQPGRKQIEHLVFERPPGDASDDRQFALGCEADDIARRHRRVVDDDAGSLGAGLGRLSGRIIERDRCQLGQRHDVVE